jgi:hypothetical protein
MCRYNKGALSSRHRTASSRADAELEASHTLLTASSRHTLSSRHLTASSRGCAVFSVSKLHTLSSRHRTASSRACLICVCRDCRDDGPASSRAHAELEASHSLKQRLCSVLRVKTAHAELEASHSLKQSLPYLCVQGLQG